MAKVALLLGLLLSAFVVADTALADNSDLEKMSWALQDEVLQWENLGPGAAYQAVKLCVYTNVQVSPKQIEAIKETGSKVLGSMLNQVVVEISNPAMVRALAKLSFVGYIDFVVPFTSGPVPIASTGSVQTAAEEKKASIQHQLQANEAVISYSVKDDALLIQVIDYKHVYAPRSVSISKQGLTENIVRLYAALSSPTGKGEWELQKELASLYDLLIRPVQSELVDKDALIIVPDGPLWRVPFSALVIKDKSSALRLSLGVVPPYLVEDYTISYWPSLEAATPFQKTKPMYSTGGLLGIFSQRLHGYGKTIKRSLEMCSHCLGVQTSSIAIAAAEELTETEFKERAQSASFIALFAPTTFKALNPQESYISFAASKDDDGMLQAQEVAALELPNLDLVVLGTAEPLPEALRLGNLSGAEEQPAYTGVVLVWPQVFLNAGADAVIQPLWPANPVELLVAMCEYHNQGNTWAQALAKAQRDLIKSDTLSNPFFWAPYQLIGRWR